MTYKKHNNRKLRNKLFLSTYRHQSVCAGFTITREVIDNFLNNFKDMSDPGILLQTMREV